MFGSQPRIPSAIRLAAPAADPKDPTHLDFVTAAAHLRSRPPHAYSRSGEVSSCKMAPNHCHPPRPRIESQCTSSVLPEVKCFHEKDGASLFDNWTERHTTECHTVLNVFKSADGTHHAKCMAHGSQSKEDYYLDSDSRVA